MTTPDHPSPTPAEPPLVIGHWSLVIPALGAALLLGLSILPPSSTRIHAWPWAFYAAIGWLLPILVALTRLALRRPRSRFGGLLDAGFALLALSAIASAFTSPLRGVVVPHLLPFLGTCALPYALLPLFHPEPSPRTRLVGAGVLAITLGTSLLLWLQPWGTFPGLHSRNAQPFGHANITGSVAVLAAFWFAFTAVVETSRRRLAFVFGAAVALATAASSGSRGAVLALAAAALVGGALVFLRRGRLLLFLALVLGVFVVGVASNDRLRDLVVHQRWSASSSESNDQRTAMLLGGLRLGSERPLLGWGPGSVPHVFPRTRADLPGTADNFLQLHNTPVQLWATLGASGLLAAALLLAGLVARLRATPWTPPRIVLASALTGTAVQLLFDHPFATPLFAVLATALISAWSNPPADASASRAPRLTALVAALILAPLLVLTTRDLLARSAYADALDQASAGRPDAYVAFLNRARGLAPGDPFYAHQLASHFATGSPFPQHAASRPADAIALLQDSLRANPDLEYAHYNLGWLLLDTAPQRAADHFLQSARLAPQRGGVYLGLGFACIQTGDTDAAVRAFAVEWLLDPAVAWSPIWHKAPLDALRPRVQSLAAAALPQGSNPWLSLDEPSARGPAYRRLRTGYGVLMGHPDGPPPVDVNIQQRVLLPEPINANLKSAPRLTGRELLDFLNTPDSPPRDTP